jgi:hypothetical protein
LYNQSPWVASNAAVAVPGNVRLLGLMLLRNEGIFGCFLHMYNMLAQLSIIPKIPVLEDLCELFLDEAFMGTRPTEKFSNILLRFNKAPARLYERKGIPTMSTWRDAGQKCEERIDPLKVSVFLNLFFRASRFDTYTFGKLAADMKLKFLGICQPLESSTTPS